LNDIAHPKWVEHEAELLFSKRKIPFSCRLPITVMKLMSFSKNLLFIIGFLILPLLLLGCGASGPIMKKWYTSRPYVAYTKPSKPMNEIAILINNEDFDVYLGSDGSNGKRLFPDGKDYHSDNRMDSSSMTGAGIIEVKDYTTDTLIRKWTWGRTRKSFRGKYDSKFQRSAVIELLPGRYKLTLNFLTDSGFYSSTSEKTVIFDAKGGKIYYPKANVSESRFSMSGLGWNPTIEEVSDDFKLKIFEGRDYYWIAIPQIVRAAKKNNLDKVMALASNKGLIDQSDNVGRTALYWSIKQKNIPLVKFLIENGANIEHKNLYGHSPLHVAVLGGSLEITDILLNQGAKVNQVGFNGQIPLSLAVWKGHESIAERLLDNGSKVNQPTNSPILYAMEHPLSLTQLLIKHGANVNSILTSEDPLSGITPLQVAVVKGKFEHVKLLIEKGADPYAKAKVKTGKFKGLNALEIAKSKGHSKITQYLENLVTPLDPAMFKDMEQLRELK